MTAKSMKRDARGRFACGNVGGPGRPSAPKQQEYWTLLRGTVDLREWKKAVEAILAKAQAGDVKAFSALAKFLLPLPAQLLKISAEPQEEYRVAGLTPDRLDEEMMNRLFQKIAERRQYEAQIQDGSRNGAGVPRIADQSNPGTRRSGR